VLERDLAAQVGQRRPGLLLVDLGAGREQLVDAVEPANASVIWVPIDAIWTSGAATSPVKNTYMKNSPSVIVPASIARPPTSVMITPTAPTTRIENAVVAETPVSDRATLRSSRWARGRTPAARGARRSTP